MWLLLLLAPSARALHAVNVEVRRSLSVPPAAASAAWLDYTWSGGGGLPGLLLREPSDAAVPRERLILPLGLRETLDEAAGTTLRYRVTGAGLARDVVDGSHAASTRSSRRATRSARSRCRRTRASTSTGSSPRRRREGADRVYVLGESIGAGVALAAGKQSKAVDGLVLVSPATSWADTPLGGAREAPLNAPDLVLMAVVAISAYQLLDSDQLATTVRRVASCQRLALSGRSRGAAVGRRRGPGDAAPRPPRRRRRARTIRPKSRKSVAIAAAAVPASGGGSAWIEPAYAAAATDALATIACPVLCVAGSADLRVPAEAEAARIAPRRAALRVVPGAGHAGATDDRVDLAALLADWRAGRVAVRKMARGGRGTTRRIRGAGGGARRRRLWAKSPSPGGRWRC
ncbi:hypothetical protein JL722_8316 [Aureococcus anophagefferens]|nr:hypothetical protein JL722_8316 [Aureococcus anophagefferens]